MTGNYYTPEILTVWIPTEDMNNDNTADIQMHIQENLIEPCSKMKSFKQLPKEEELFFPGMSSIIG